MLEGYIDLISSMEWYCYEPTLLDKILRVIGSPWFLLAVVVILAAWLYFRGIEVT
jgi:hypothetical protein